MRYMMLIYSQEDEKAPTEAVAEVAEAHRQLMTETRLRGVFRAADPLQRSSTATTVRSENGKVLLTDGPYAETKEQLAGYYILECRDLDEAIAWAARIPTACLGGSGCVEVRPLRDMAESMHDG
ncbi:hypothetical protein ACPOL_5882 [Acidisarcina polymorpha]|uniref:YCII-related domain-containing protein n=1 Tax=Acidisarcina polymorpha TaxID=2211140 RepID=A0A2Z5G994_9BACT|nr:YciI family protein [Acidisarcina polymorpha]AXC15126.1 hypothetical protein ACPOL_5882 [Acidisarcina polymorpha]